jgi:hypothetical protein
MNLASTPPAITLLARSVPTRPVGGAIKKFGGFYIGCPIVNQEEVCPYFKKLNYIGSMIRLTSFDWSTIEQVYPYERDRLGRILYCKEISIGALPNNTTKNVAHNIAALDTSKVFKVYGGAYNGGTFYQMGIARQNDWGCEISVGSTNVSVRALLDYSSYTGWAHVIWAK